MKTSEVKELFKKRKEEIKPHPILVNAIDAVSRGVSVLNGYNLYCAYHNEIPNRLTVSDIDNNKATQWLEKVLEKEILEIIKDTVYINGRQQTTR